MKQAQQTVPPVHDPTDFTHMSVGMFAGWFRVPGRGFRIDDRLVAREVRGHAPDEARPPWLVAPLTLDEPFVEPGFAPFQDRGLYRAFSKLRPEANDILAFADKFGWLGAALPLVDPDDRPDATTSGKTPRFKSLGDEQVPAAPRGAYRDKWEECEFGESLGYWRREIAEMAQLVAVWDLVAEKNRDRLAECVRWDRDGSGEPVVTIRLVTSGTEVLVDVIQRAWHGDFDSIPAIQDIWQRRAVTAWRWDTILPGGIGVPSREDLLARWTPGDALEPARYYVYSRVNNRMAGHISPAVLPYYDNRVYFFPDTLLAALYTLFALDMSSNAAPVGRLCARPGCGEYFVPTRRNQTYCTNNCAKLASYYRVKERKPNG